MTKWNLYGNGELIGSFPSHRQANKVRRVKIEESVKNELHIHFEVKKEKVPKVKETPMWKKSGFKSQSEYDEWYNETCEEIRMGVLG